MSKFRLMGDHGLERNALISFLVNRRHRAETDESRETMWQMICASNDFRVRSISSRYLHALFVVTNALVNNETTFCTKYSREWETGTPDGQPVLYEPSSFLEIDFSWQLRLLHVFSRLSAKLVLCHGPALNFQKGL